MRGIFRWIDKRWKYFFTVPTVIFGLVMIAFPIGYTLVLSMAEINLSSINSGLIENFVGLDNYIELFEDEVFIESIVRTFIFAGIALVFETVIGVGLAVFFSRNFIGKNIVKTLMILPMVAMPVAMGLVWKLILDPNIGVANIMLEKIGLERQLWLTSGDSVLGTLILMDVWGSVPLIMLIVLAGYAGLPAEVSEAAVVDGASSWQSFWRVTFPLLSPTILVAVLFRLIEVLKTFDSIYATTQGGPNYASTTLNLYAYKNAFEYFKFGKSSAIIIIFFAIVMGMALLFLQIKKRIEVEL